MEPEMLKDAFADRITAWADRPARKSFADTPLQRMIDASPDVRRIAQFQSLADAHVAQANTGFSSLSSGGGNSLPDKLKSGVESLSGLPMDDVKVHYNSDKPAQLQAHAYAQGTDIHLAPGQEKHLAHEAWHVVQQKEGRVPETAQLKGVGLNDDAGLEREADVMGAKAEGGGAGEAAVQRKEAHDPGEAVQRKAVVQRQRIVVTVTGTTHLVKIRGGSVFEGPEAAELGHGVEVEIETTQKVRSRRGPNQELYRVFDEDGGKDYRWFKVLAVAGKAVPDGLYIRDNTFDTPDRSVLGTRPAKIDGQGRDRVAPENINAHEVATTILQDGTEMANSSNIMHWAAEKWQSANGTGHDPRRTLRNIAVAAAYADNPDVRSSVAQEKGGLLARNVASMLEKVIAWQLFQEWSMDYAEQVPMRSAAWQFLQDGIAHFTNGEARDKYLCRVLLHDKGYAQTFEAAFGYTAYGRDGSTEEMDMAKVFEAAMQVDSNRNIWVGGMAGSGVIGKQLLREDTSSELYKKRSPGYQENEMWTAVVTNLFNAAKKEQGDKAFAKAIKTNEAQIFQAVRRIVPESFQLSQHALAEVLTMYEV